MFYYLLEGSEDNCSVHLEEDGFLDVVPYDGEKEYSFEYLECTSPIDFEEHADDDFVNCPCTQILWSSVMERLGKDKNTIFFKNKELGLMTHLDEDYELNFKSFMMGDKKRKKGPSDSNLKSNF